jgi:hypothetical protein
MQSYPSDDIAIESLPSQRWEVQTSFPECQFPETNSPNGMMHKPIIGRPRTSPLTPSHIITDATGNYGCGLLCQRRQKGREAWSLFSP